MNARLLIVEDDADIAKTLSDLLVSEGHDVETVSDGHEGLARAAEGNHDLLLLDIMLPGIDGFELCRAVRDAGFQGGILMLTARGMTVDRVKGLRIGADDYLIKPWDPEELLARIDALLRRTMKDSHANAVAICGKLKADFNTMSFTCGDDSIRLTGKEADLLKCLNEHEGELLTRDDLLASVWHEQPHITKRTVDVHISWLRQKVEEDPHHPRHIQTVRGKGYRFIR